ncbi:hypothetical protein [Mucilaginibacter lacusdianchii]|uniref:hypothetical protein n=1 Tax=Mucilaginibacter lacusdianchii TaxID=2684211 RepID=UPI00131DFCA8|nr:hypothetical protein [Mucilaginibacter sp. JXJ CY 39]
MKSKFYLTVLLFSSFIFSCKKDNNSESGEDVAKRYLQLLSNKPWKRSVTDKNAATNPKDKELLFNAVNECELDNRYNFNNNGYSLIIDNGMSSCSNETQLQGVNYSADFAKQEIVINGQKFILAELSETQLKYYAVVSRSSGFVNMVYLYEH